MIKKIIKIAFYIYLIFIIIMSFISRDYFILLALTAIITISHELYSYRKKLSKLHKLIYYITIFVCILFLIEPMQRIIQIYFH